MAQAGALTYSLPSVQLAYRTLSSQPQRHFSDNTLNGKLSTPSSIPRIPQNGWGALEKLLGGYQHALLTEDLSSAPGPGSLQHPSPHVTPALGSDTFLWSLWAHACTQHTHTTHTDKK